MVSFDVGFDDTIVKTMATFIVTPTTTIVPSTTTSSSTSSTSTTRPPPVVPEFVLPSDSGFETLMMAINITCPARVYKVRTNNPVRVASSIVGNVVGMSKIIVVVLTSEIQERIIRDVSEMFRVAHLFGEATKESVTSKAGLHVYVPLAGRVAWSVPDTLDCISAIFFVVPHHILNDTDRKAMVIKDDDLVNRVAKWRTRGAFSFMAFIGLDEFYSPVDDTVMIMLGGESGVKKERVKEFKVVV